MDTTWAGLHRPLLSKVLNDFYAGHNVIDIAAYAADLSVALVEVDAAFELLCAARFFHATRHEGGWLIDRVCPLARQITGKMRAAGRSSTALLAWTVVDQIKHDR